MVQGNYQNLPFTIKGEHAVENVKEASYTRPRRGVTTSLIAQDGWRRLTCSGSPVTAQRSGLGKDWPLQQCRVLVVQLGDHLHQTHSPGTGGIHVLEIAVEVSDLGIAAVRSDRLDRQSTVF